MEKIILIFGMFVWGIVTPYSIKIDEKIVQKIIENVSKTVEKKQNGAVNIVFVKREEIQNLNAKYRDKDSITDVLSFHYFEDFSGLNSEDIAGELIFCEEEIIKQGKDYGLGSEMEFYKLLIHSLLHILGFDHEEDKDYIKMQKLEDQIAQETFGKKL